MPSRFIKPLGRTLDARPDRLDLRDREFAPQVRSLSPIWPEDADLARLLPAYAAAGLVRDQGAEGACTGFGLAAVVNYLLFSRRGAQRAESVSPRMLFHLARFYDEWPGESYDGSSCRGALKAWHKHGVCSEALWPYPLPKRGLQRPHAGWDRDALTRTLGVYYRIDHSSVVDMQAAIFQIGAIFVAAQVHDGWKLRAGQRPERTRGARQSNSARVVSHANLPRINPLRRSDSLGGHAFALVGYNETGFIVQNSWGPSWGAAGFAVLPYELWNAHGHDAWVCALGVPADSQGVRQRASHVAVYGPGSTETVANASVVLRATLTPPPQLPAAVTPWSTERALLHTLVFGNDGRVINRVVIHRDAADTVRQLASAAPLEYFNTARGVPRLAIYVHGGLNSEEESVQRIQVLAPYFRANGIYPLFITWKTGALETLHDILADQLQRIPRPDGGVRDRFREVAANVLDRTIEVVAGPVAKPIWSQMKQNAAAAIERGMGLELLATALRELSEQLPRLQIHLIGHSAGSLMLGHLLTRMSSLKLSADSCHLYAPACNIRFALEHYALAFKRGTLAAANTHLHVLSDRREREDTVGPYRKSLLYLVSRALERNHATPLLGLELAHSAAPTRELWHEEELAAAEQWQALARRRPTNLYVIDSAQVSTGRLGNPVKASHGSFDNDAALITSTLSRICGGALQFPVQWLEY
jgi:Papain family cysteine protease